VIVGSCHQEKIIFFIMSDGDPLCRIFFLNSTILNVMPMGILNGFPTVMVAKKRAVPNGNALLDGYNVYVVMSDKIILHLRNRAPSFQEEWGRAFLTKGIVD